MPPPPRLFLLRYIDQKEMQLGFRQFGVKLNRSQVKKIMERIDTDKNGKVEEHEFVALVAHKARQQMTRQYVHGDLAMLLPKDGGVIHPNRCVCTECAECAECAECTQCADVAFVPASSHLCISQSNRKPSTHPSLSLFLSHSRTVASRCIGTPLSSSSSSTSA